MKTHSGAKPSGRQGAIPVEIQVEAKELIGILEETTAKIKALGSEAIKAAVAHPKSKTAI